MWPRWPHPYSTLILWVFPLYQIAHVMTSPSRNLALFGREIIFEEEFQPVWSRYLNVTDRRTDGHVEHTAWQADKQTIYSYCDITALCVVSCGNHLLLRQKADTENILKLKKYTETKYAETGKQTTVYVLMLSFSYFANTKQKGESTANEWEIENSDCVHTWATVAGIGFRESD